VRGSARVPGVVRVVVLVATFQLGRLEPALAPHAYIWLLAAWVAICAGITNRSAELRATAETA
jgi:hypothetical protein